MVKNGAVNANRENRRIPSFEVWPLVRRSVFNFLGW